MCGSGASRHTKCGSLSPSVKVASLSSCDWEDVLAPALIRVKNPRNPRMLGSGAVAANLEMMPQVRCTCARVGAGWKVRVAVRFGWGGK